MVALQDEYYHKMLRQPFASIYSNRSLASVEHHIDSTVNAFIARLQDFAEFNKTFDFGFWVQLFVFDALCEVTFSKRLGFIDEGRDVGDMLALVWQQFHDGTPVSTKACNIQAFLRRLMEVLDKSDALDRLYLEEKSTDSPTLA